jgi:drug/metabolite transporter (DMT)-like permease
MNAPILTAPDLTTRSDGRALLVLIAGAVAIGWSPILVRLGHTGPAATGFWRLAFALPWLGVLVARPGAAGDAMGALKTPMIWLCALFFALDLSFWHYGIHFTSVANATVLSNLTPILVTVFAWLVLKQAPKPLFLLGMALAIAGAVGMAVFKGGVDGRPPSFLGDFLSVLTAVWYGAYFLVVRRVRETFSTAAVMWGTSLIGLAPLLMAAVLLREPLTPATPGEWAALVALGFVHVTGQGSIAWALGRLPTSLAAVVVLVQPVVAGLLGWWLFAEAMTPMQGACAALALAGVAVAQLSARKPQPVEAPEA